MNTNIEQIDEDGIDIKETLRTIYRYRYMTILLVILFARRKRSNVFIVITKPGGTGSPAFIISPRAIALFPILFLFLFTFSSLIVYKKSPDCLLIC